MTLITATPTRYSTGGAVAAADHLAASAGVAMLDRGGNAVDAAVAAAAVMAVTSPHQCGLGGDLFALVVPARDQVIALNASGRAGSGADPHTVRARGLSRMTFQGDIDSTTVPGCVDGLLAMADRYGTRKLPELFEPARRLADDGFPVPPLLAQDSRWLPTKTHQTAFGVKSPSTPVNGSPCRPWQAPCARSRRTDALDSMRAISRASCARTRLSFTPRRTCDNPQPNGSIRCRCRHSATPYGRLPPTRRATWPSQALGSLTPSASPPTHLTATGRAAGSGVPPAAFDRLHALHEHADGHQLLSPTTLGPRAQAVSERPQAVTGEQYERGDTTCICAVDSNGQGVSLIMSNGAAFGSAILLPDAGVFLHNRGVGFSLTEGHPAEYGPGRRPPHTLTPVAVTADGSLKAVLGSMGGDAQPHIILQLLARWLVAGQAPGDVIGGPRWMLSREPTNGFDTWEARTLPIVRLEPDAPESWAHELSRLGYEISWSKDGDHSFGHAQMITLPSPGVLAGAADLRSRSGAFVGR